MPSKLSGDETADPAIYQFGSTAGKDDGPKYVQPGNDGKVLYLQTVEADNAIPDEIDVYFIETTLEDLVAQHPDEVFWALNMDLVYTDFDFSWRPDVYQSNYIHAFGSSLLSQWWTILPHMHHTSPRGAWCSLWLDERRLRRLRGVRFLPEGHSPARKHVKH